jgi:Protein of unknown function (DUF1761)
MSNVNEIAILVSALLALAVGSIWYSPLVFGKLWQKAAGLTDADLELSPSAFLRSLSVAFISNIVVLSVIAHLIRFADTYAISGMRLMIGAIILLGASVASMVVWEKRSLMYFIIHVGYAALVVILGFVILTYWPW